MLNKKGEIMVGTGVKILAAVVVGSLLLFGTYAVVSETVMPSANQKIAELFDVAPENQGGNSTVDGNETIYDNELIESKYGMRLIVISKNLIESRYGIAIEESDVHWIINGEDAGTGLYYATANADPLPVGTTVQAVICVSKGSISDNPNCHKISSFYLD